MSNSEQTTKSDQENNPKKRKRWNQETIIEKGRELFSEKGFDLSMRDLASSLNTQASSLYRHVQSKRELWFAITTKDYDDFGRGIQEVVMNHTTERALDILRKIGEFFLEFARDDFNRFKLMFLYEPPKENDSGPFERACKPDSLTGLIQICQIIIEQEQLTKIEANHLAIVIYSQILGYAVITSPINDYLLSQKDFSYISNPDFDKFMLDSMILSISNFK